MGNLTGVVRKNLLALRKKRGWTQDTVAGLSGLSVSYVSMLERGRRSPPLATLEVLAATFRVPPTSLLKVRP